MVVSQQLTAWHYDFTKYICRMVGHSVWQIHQKEDQTVLKWQNVQDLWGLFMWGFGRTVQCSTFRVVMDPVWVVFFFSPISIKPAYTAEVHCRCILVSFHVVRVCCRRSYLLISHIAGETQNICGSAKRSSCFVHSVRFTLQFLVLVHVSQMSEKIFVGSDM